MKHSELICTLGKREATDLKVVSRKLHTSTTDTRKLLRLRAKPLTTVALIVHSGSAESETGSLTKMGTLGGSLPSDGDEV